MGNSSEIEANLKRLVSPDDVIEVRIFSDRYNTVSGYYNDFNKLADDIKEYDGKAPIYFTVNPVKPDLLARSENKLKRYAKNTTADSDIIRRRFLLIDLDPKRPSGISSTDEELEKAIDLAKKIRTELASEYQFYKSILSTSGNGAHLLYNIDLDNTAKSTELIKNCLETISFFYSNEVIEIDTSVHSPAQLTRLYGTINPKGDNTELRPHRRSKLLEVPNDLKVVGKDKLNELAENNPQLNSSQNASGARSASNLGTKEWIESKGLEIASSGPWNGGEKFVLERCPWNEEHTNRSAYIVRLASGALAAGCHHDSCSDEDWHSLREAVDPDFQRNAYSSLLSEKGNEEDKQIEILKTIIADLEFFTNDLDEPYVILPIDGHKEVWSVDSKKVEMFLLQKYLEKTSTVPGDENLSKTKKIMSAMSVMGDGNISQKLYRRVGIKGDSYYYDLVDERWRGIEIKPGSVEILEDPPAIFHRTKNMQTQVVPDLKNHDIELIFNHINLEDEEDRLVYLAYIVSALVPNIAHPILAVHGEKGSSKSTFTKITNALIDPARQDLLSLPNSKRDLAITLYNNYLSSFDNMDTLSKEKSNLLCQASTGGAFTTRALYTNTEEAILELTRCVILNGINLVMSEPDIIDRAIIFQLERIDREEYLEDSTLWSNFEKDRPAIFGGMVNALAKAREIYPEVELDRLGRMGGFTKWGYAIIEALGESGDDFVSAYFKNKGSSNEEIISSHPLANAVVKMMHGQKEEEGMYSEILKRLESTARNNSINTVSKLWPASASALSRRLREVKSNLEEIGIKYESRKKSKGKVIRLVNEHADEQKKPKNKSKTFKLDL